MKKHVFIRPVGLVFKPNCDRPEPENITFHLIDIDQRASVQTTLDELIEMNGDSGDERSFSFRTGNRRAKNFGKPNGKGMAG